MVSGETSRPKLILEDLDPVLAQRLAERAEPAGASIEDEARRILRAALGVEEPLSAVVRRLFKDDGLGPDEEFPEFRGEQVRKVDFGE